MPMGFLEIFVGPMFAGKSAHLIAAAAEYPGALCLTPAFDKRSGASLKSRDGRAIAARPIASWPNDIPAGHPLIVDEVQFLQAPYYDGDIVADLMAARAAGAIIRVGGLDTDFRRLPFTSTQRLMHAADRVVALTARCHVCGAPARWTAKTHDTGQRLETGDLGLYEARCGAHWALPPDDRGAQN